MWTQSTTWKLAIGLVVIWFLGCRSAAPLKPQPIIAASDGVAGVVAHTESAERHVQSAIPHSDQMGKLYLTAASDEHKEVLDDASQTKTALIATQQLVDSLNTDMTNQQEAYQKLESRWYVVWGKRIQRALWIIGISWLLLGIGSIVLGLGNPLGWATTIGKEIVHLVPAMNLFAWLRDWLARRRAAAAPIAGNAG